MHTTNVTTLVITNPSAAVKSPPVSMLSATARKRLARMSDIAEVVDSAHTLVEKFPDGMATIWQDGTCYVMSGKELFTNYPIGSHAEVQALSDTIEALDSGVHEVMVLTIGSFAGDCGSWVETQKLSTPAVNRSFRELNA